MTNGFAKMKVMASVALLAIIAAGYFYRHPLWTLTLEFWRIFSSRDAIQKYIVSWGVAAPLIFTTIQILQVVIAPIPGEATGFVGGYIFGAFRGFLYSSIGLAIGSMINFAIGRLLGKQFIRRVIPRSQIAQMDKLVHKQGAVILFICFLFPGFPKDYLCLFLGVSDISTKLFFLMAALGRMPGTLALSIQGASLYNREYVLTGAIMVFCVVCAYLSYRYKDKLYNWMERLNGGPTS